VTILTTDFNQTFTDNFAVEVVITPTVPELTQSRNLTIAIDLIEPAIPVPADNRYSITKRDFGRWQLLDSGDFMLAAGEINYLKQMLFSQDNDYSWIAAALNDFYYKTLLDVKNLGLAMFPQAVTANVPGAWLSQTRIDVDRLLLSFPQQTSGMVIWTWDCDNSSPTLNPPNNGGIICGAP
jgi:hypothetical protein